MGSSAAGTASGTPHHSVAIMPASPAGSTNRRSSRSDPPAAQLQRFIQQRYPRGAKAIVGYAIATPDVEWTVDGPDIDLALVYDQRDRARPFADFMDRVIEYWKKRLSAMGRNPEPLSRRDRQAVIDSIRGDFQLVPVTSGQCRGCRPGACPAHQRAVPAFRPAQREPSCCHPRRCRYR